MLLVKQAVNANRASLVANSGAEHYIREIYLAQKQGATGLPQMMGLSEAEYVQCFASAAITAADDTRQELLELRRDEWNELKQLLLEHLDYVDCYSTSLAKIIATACLSGGHLWRDLGLSSRDKLKQLMTENFSALAQRNHKNMRWKKFFYKQLCEQQGGYVCRSPSCETCTSYDECFGEEL